MYQLDRRAALGLVGGAAVVSALLTIPARAQQVLDLGELEKIIQTPRLRMRILVYTDLTKDILLSHLFEIDQNVTNYDEFSSESNNVDPWSSWRELRNWVRDFYRGKSNDILLAALQEDDAREWTEGAAKVSQDRLIKSVGFVFEKTGIAVDGPAGQGALSTIQTVEQLSALQNRKVPDTPFLCRYFPFSRFCGDG